MTDLSEEELLRNQREEENRAFDSLLTPQWKKVYESMQAIKNMRATMKTISRLEDLFRKSYPAK